MDDLPTTAEFNARTLVAASYFDPAADTVVLGSTGLNNISIADPAGVADTWPEMSVQLWRWQFKKKTQTSTEIKTYDDSGNTVRTTQALSDDGTTVTVGAAQ